MSFVPPGPRTRPVPARKARVSAVAAACLSVLAVPFAGAQTAPAAPPTPSSPAAAGAVALDGIVVTATRTPGRIDRSLAEVTVVDRAEIEASAGRTLADVLARQPGVQAWSNGGLGKTASVSLRGLEARHVLLLVDGVRVGSATVGTPSWDNLPLEAIERIEIVRGPLSSLYGSDAVGGVVQVFTRGGRQGLRPHAAVTVGPDGHRQAGAGVSGGHGPVDGALGVQVLRSDGGSATNPRAPFGAHNPDRDGFDQDAATARAGVALPGGWRADAHLLVSRGITQYDDGPGADARAALRNRVASVQAAGPVVGPWRTRLALGDSRDEFETLASASPFASLGVTSTQQRQATWEHTVRTPAGTALLLVERVEQVVSRPGRPYTVPERTITGVAAGLDGSAGAHHWQAAVRRDRNSQFGEPTTGTLAYGYDVTPQLRIAASGGTSFVAPSFNQLYFPGFGNPALLPEEGLHQEASIRWADAGQVVRVAWVRNRIRGYIPSGPLPANIPRARMDGLMASWDGQLGDWTIGASAEMLEPVNDTAGSANVGRLLPRRAAETARLTADRRLGAWTVGAAVRKVGQRFEDAANTQPIAGHTRLDLQVERPLGTDWRLGVRLDNATDRRYETTLGYDQPGRQAFVTLRWAPR